MRGCFTCEVDRGLHAWPSRGLERGWSGKLAGNGALKAASLAACVQILTRVGPQFGSCLARVGNTWAEIGQLGPDDWPCLPELNILDLFRSSLTKTRPHGHLVQIRASRANIGKVWAGFSRGRPHLADILGSRGPRAFHRSRFCSESSCCRPSACEAVVGRRSSSAMLGSDVGELVDCQGTEPIRNFAEILAREMEDRRNLSPTRP